MRRAGRFYARITLHREPPLPSGEHRRAEVPLVAPTGKTLTPALARALAHRYQSRYDDGTWQPESATARGQADGVTVATWVDAWLSKQTYRTAATERSKCALWLGRTALGKVQLSRVTPHDVVSFVEQLRAGGARSAGFGTDSGERFTAILGTRYPRPVPLRAVAETALLVWARACRSGRCSWCQRGWSSGVCRSCRAQAAPQDISNS